MKNLEQIVNQKNLFYRLKRRIASYILGATLGLTGIIGCKDNSIHFVSDRDNNVTDINGIYSINLDNFKVKKLMGQKRSKKYLVFKPIRFEYPAFSPNKEEIAFASDKNGNYEIYVMNKDGSNIRNLTNHPTRDVEPSWSPDGKQIAFQTNRSGMNEIYLMNKDGSDQKNLAIAFQTKRDGMDEMYLVKKDDEMYIMNRGNDCSPEWSPDGKQIVFVSNRFSNNEICITNPDGSNFKRLTKTDYGEYSPKWSPDGKQIAFIRSGGEYNLYIMDKDGSNIKKLTDTPLNKNTDFTWSPDGNQLIFELYEKHNFEVYAINKDGSNIRNLTNHPAMDASPF